MNPITPENQSPPSPIARTFRILGIFLGGCLLVWLQLEDANERWVLLFSAAISALAAAQVWVRLTKRFGQGGHRLPISGLLAGILVTPAALVLMALKTGLHGHQGPDFSGDQIQAVILRTPIWLISGLLVGIGLEVFRRANSPNPGGE